jgi:hypothetical protein
MRPRVRAAVESAMGSPVSGVACGGKVRRREERGGKGEERKTFHGASGSVAMKGRTRPSCALFRVASKSVGRHALRWPSGAAAKSGG